MAARLNGSAMAMFVRADAFEAIGAFPEIALMEDNAFSRRLKRLGPPACLRARDRLAAPLGTLRCVAHRLADVAYARRLLLRCGPGATGAGVSRHASRSTP